MEEKYYYLRKNYEPEEIVALYKHNFYNRFYRSSYPVPDYKSLKLYKAKRLSTIMRQRQVLHDYCNEWFDVYDQDDKKVEIGEE